MIIGMRSDQRDCGLRKLLVENQNQIKEIYIEDEFDSRSRNITVKVSGKAARSYHFTKKNLEIVTEELEKMLELKRRKIKEVCIITFSISIYTPRMKISFLDGKHIFYPGTKENLELIKNYCAPHKITECTEDEYDKEKLVMVMGFIFTVTLLLSYWGMHKLDQKKQDKNTGPILGNVPAIIQKYESTTSQIEKLEELKKSLSELMQKKQLSDEQYNNNIIAYNNLTNGREKRIK